MFFRKQSSVRFPFEEIVMLFFGSLRGVLPTPVLFAVLVLIPLTLSSAWGNPVQTRHNENSVALKAQAERFETDFGRIIDNLAEWGGFDDALLVAIVLVESSGNSKARNKKSGAQGFGQLKPIAKREAGCAKVLKPEENLACMTNYLAVLRDKEGFTSKHEMLLAYNLGPSKAREALSNDPWIAVTHFFVIRVLGTETLISES